MNSVQYTLLTTTPLSQTKEKLYDINNRKDLEKILGAGHSIIKITKSHIYTKPPEKNNNLIEDYGKKQPELDALTKKQISIKSSVNPDFLRTYYMRNIFFDLIKEYNEMVLTLNLEIEGIENTLLGSRTEKKVYKGNSNSNKKEAKKTKNELESRLKTYEDTNKKLSRLFKKISSQ